VGVMQVAAGLLRSLVFTPDNQRLYITGDRGIEVLEAPRVLRLANQVPLTKVFATPSDSIWAP
jgi:hypothetical protein